MIIINRKDQILMKALFAHCKRTRLPTLQQVKITVDGDDVCFEATDLETWVLYKRRLKGETLSRICYLPYSLLSEKMNDDFVISIPEGSDGKSFEFKNGMITKTVDDEWLHAEYPENILLKGTEMMGSARFDLKELCDVACFSSKDETRQPIFQRWSVDGKTLFCTDGRRLALFGGTSNDDDVKWTVFQHQAILSQTVRKWFGNFAALLTTHWKKGEKEQAVEKVSKMVLESEGCLIEILHKDGVFGTVNYKQVIPVFDAEHPARHITLTPEQKTAIEQMHNQKALRISITKDCIEGVFADGVKLKIATSVQTEIEKIIFNPLFLIQCLNYCNTLQFKAHDGLSPAVFENATTQRMALLMPFRVT